MAAAVIQTVDWEQSWQLRMDAEVAIKEYMDMRTQWRLLQREWQTSQDPTGEYW